MTSDLICDVTILHFNNQIGAQLIKTEKCIKYLNPL